jgi:hypothetical protein
MTICLILYLPSFSATYKGNSIDKEKHPALLWEKGNKVKYRVTVVFVEKRANIVFSPNQILPVRFSRNQYLTLYLKDKKIKDPDQILLRELVPPDEDHTSENDLDKWKEVAVWFMSIDL